MCCLLVTSDFSIPSPYALGLPRQAVYSIRPIARRDDPKCKRLLAASANNERSLMPKSHSSAPVTPLQSGLGTVKSNVEVAVAGDVDDDQSSHATGSSASLGPLERSRKRRSSNSNVDDSRPRSTTIRRVHQRRRLETSKQRVGFALHALAERACCAYICIRTADNSLRIVPELPLPHGKP